LYLGLSDINIIGELLEFGYYVYGFFFTVFFHGFSSRFFSRRIGRIKLSYAGCLSLGLSVIIGELLELSYYVDGFLWVFLLVFLAVFLNGFITRRITRIRLLC